MYPDGVPVPLHGLCVNSNPYDKDDKDDKDDDDHHHHEKKKEVMLIKFKK